MAKRQASLLSFINNTTLTTKRLRITDSQEEDTDSKNNLYKQAWSMLHVA